MKKQRKYFPVLLQILSCFFISSCDKSTNETVKPLDAKIEKEGKVYSNYTMDYNNSNKKIFSELVGDVRSGQSVLIMESREYSDFKIQLADGTMGWIEGEYLQPSEKTYIKYHWEGGNQHISSTHWAVESDREIVKEVTGKTAVTRMEEYRQVKKIRGKDNTIPWTKVLTEDGTEGWIMSDYLYTIYIDPYRFISRKKWRFSIEEFMEEWKGESIDEFTTKFKEPSGIEKREGQDIRYFNNIFLYGNRKVNYGIRISVKDNVIENIEAGARKTSWVSYLPLSSTLRINLIGNYLGNWDYMFESTGDPNSKRMDLRDYMPEWLTWIVFLIIFLIGLAILYFILKIPFLIVNKITIKQSLNRKLFNGRIMLYATLGSIILGYTFGLILMVNVYPFNEYFFFVFLICLGMIIGNIGKWRNDLDYNRCNAATCHQWTGEHSWTEYLGGEDVTRTYNDGSTRTQKTRRYREHRKCSACGHEWSILRREVIGGLKY